MQMLALSPRAHSRLRPEFGGGGGGGHAVFRQLKLELCAERNQELQLCG